MMVTSTRLLCTAILLLATTVPSDAQTAVPRAEHPRPDFVRADWRTLNGPWQFEFDDANAGLAGRWYAADHKLARQIVVPYVFQSRLSGIGDPAFHDVVWYRRTFDVPDAWKGRRLLLHFGAVDYEAIVWVNGQMVARHEGGHTPFNVDVTHALVPGANVVTLRVWDPSTDRAIPRGKQYWRPKSEGIFYTRTTGIWQPVWIEAAAPVHVTRLKVTPDVDSALVRVQAMLNEAGADLRLRVTTRLGEDSEESTVVVRSARPEATIALREQRLWSPERPTLYDLVVELVDAKGQTVDRVESYFGQRKVHVQNDRVYLNNAPYYLRMVLDQGYWPESVLTPPSDEAIQYDIKMTKAFGFNGARKHQKVEDPRWLYWCDRLGLLVWGEMANAYEFNEQYVARFVNEWLAAVQRDYNHPSIVAWVPINESWGAPQALVNTAQQDHLRSLYFLTRSIDPTRPVIDNDGWEHTDATDLFTLHDYARTGPQLTAKYEPLAKDRSRIPRNGREALVNGARYNGTPILMTEFGGVAYKAAKQMDEKAWGYQGIEPTVEAFLSRVDGQVKALVGLSFIGGFCYTQLTDVEQEINGLMTYDRKPKADPETIKKIFAQ
jgi:beta-galactosidase/beta-glucuronidase